MRAKVYFPGLNGLRFFAALAVVFTHVELMKRFLVYGSHWIDMGEKIPQGVPLTYVLKKDISWLGPAIANAGPLGVVFFFVLSGFLITYLLFEEKKVYNDIDVKKFYIRRFLRIWPLYFLVMILGFFVLPKIDWFNVPIQGRHLEWNFWPNFWLYLLFLPNVAFSLYVAVPNIGQSWSIGIEEQFYLMWPWVLKKAKNALKGMLYFAAAVVLVKILFLIAVRGLDPMAPGMEWIVKGKKFLGMLKLECMALGGVTAHLLYFKNEKWLNFLYQKWVQIAAYVAIPVLVYCTPMQLQDGIHIAYAFSFMVIILNVSSNPNAIFKFRWKVFDYLGKISYGIYMYHMMMVVFSIHLLPHIVNLSSRDLSAGSNLLLYSISVLLTILVSALSYHFFELRFIKMKRKVTTIESGDTPPAA